MFKDDSRSRNLLVNEKEGVAVLAHLKYFTWPKVYVCVCIQLIYVQFMYTSLST